MNHFKLTVGGSTEIEDDQAVSIICSRPENNVSSLEVRIGDWQSKNYSDVFDAHTTLQLDLKCAGRQTYTTVFSGIIHALKPAFTERGEDLIVQAWGHGIAFSKTYCDAEFGADVSAAVDTPEEILDYIIANHVDKRFGSGGASTQWGIDSTDIDAPHADFTITHINSQYLDNFTLVSQLCDLINAHANITSDISVHWYVDTAKHFRMKEIDADAGDGAWDRYYGGSATTAVMKEGVNNVVSRGFHKHINDYANHVILAAGFRKPAFDIWCEDNGPGWGNYQSVDTYSATQFIVGSHSLRVEPTVNNAPCIVFYPSSHDAGWNLTLIGSEDNIPSFNVFVYADLAAAITGGNSAILIGKDYDLYDGSGNDDYFSILTSTLMSTPEADKWYNIKVPIGPYANLSPDLSGADNEWIKVGTPVWSDIDFVALGSSNLPVPVTDYIYWDDAHFSGKIVRSCYDTSAITATNKERQIFIRMDNAVDDTLIADDDDAGMAAMIALSELYRRTVTPIVGTLTFPCKEDMLPGQTLQVYAGLKPDKSTYRWSNLPMRIKELTHFVDATQYSTTVQVTSDVTNTFAASVPNMWGILLDKAGALNHGEAKNLKVSGVDNKITRLGWDPT